MKIKYISNDVNCFIVFRLYLIIIKIIITKYKFNEIANYLTIYK